MKILICLVFVSLSSLVASITMDKPTNSRENIEVSEKSAGQNVVYNATWESLDKRPLPDWYDFSKLGIFIHWGVFSVPSFGQSPAWGWYYWKTTGSPAWIDFMAKNYKPHFSYADFAKDFTAEFYDPNEWADLFKSSGARYAVLTSKHHEGFCNWPTNHSWNWNSMAVGPHRDLVGDFAKAIKKESDLHLGLYHSLYEWYNSLYLQDKANDYQTNDFVMQKTLPELYEIVNTYKPELLWSDGQWEAESWYWNSTVFLAWLYNESPVKDIVVTNDRWGKNTPCKHGGYFTCHDRYNPGVAPNYKWENAMTLNKLSWSWRRDTDISQFLTTKEMLVTFVETVSCGGNMLMNVGPTKAGIINPILQERLEEMGKWMAVNGYAIYGTKPWHVQKDNMSSSCWYSQQTDKAKFNEAQILTKNLRLNWNKRQKRTHGNDTKLTLLNENREFPVFETTTVFVYVTEWPETNILLLSEPTFTTAASTIKMVGLEEYGVLSWTPIMPKGIAIEMPIVPISKLPHTLVWTLALTGFQ